MTPPAKTETTSTPAPETAYVPPSQRPAASFQRDRLSLAHNLITGPNTNLYASVRKGSGLRVVWANPGNGAGGVGEYRADGYDLVHPRDVEILSRNQQTPSEKDFGVYTNFDEKADRVQTVGGLTLMWCHQAQYDALIAEQQALSDQYYRKETKPVDQGAKVDFGTEVTEERVNLANL